MPKERRAFSREALKIMKSGNYLWSILLSDLFHENEIINSPS
jgi:hypothetical protein